VARSGVGATIGTPLPEDAQAVDRALACMRLLGCEALAARPFGVLSQGEQQRVLIARALLAEPALLVLDEVCSGLDVAAREQVVASLERLAADADAPTMLLVTHHVEEIAPGFTHALVLRDGGVLASGKLEEALRAEALSTAFGIPVSLTHAGGRYELRVARQ
jgi:iron complex transport system ATP-binding protein